MYYTKIGTSAQSMRYCDNVDGIDTTTVCLLSHSPTLGPNSTVNDSETALVSLVTATQHELNQA